MQPSNWRSHLHRVLTKYSEGDVSMSHWELTRSDELGLFEFIHPSVNTRDASFRLFNLPVQWDKESSALVDKQGRRLALTLAECAAEMEPTVAKLCVQFEREGAHPDAAKKAAEIAARGGKVGWSYGFPYEDDGSTI